jgi:formylglycine-generating enzyme required for sulfatase activity
MELKIRISIDAPRAGVRRLVLFLAFPLALIAAARTIARAYDTSWVLAGQPISATQLKQNLDEVQSRIVWLEGVTGRADCPPDYTKDSSVTTFTLCKKSNDEMVKVGRGPSAFWIDRYEASVWSTEGGSGTQYGGIDASNALVRDYPGTFPKNAQHPPASAIFQPLYAASVAGVRPSGSLTWFQAMEACTESGKRLPTRQEWLRAASGTVDPPPGGGDGASSTCLTAGAAPRATGEGSACRSAWGAEDMIGNLYEWTDEWYSGAGESGGSVTTPQLVNDGVSDWPAEYNGDGTWNLPTMVVSEAGPTAALPAAGVRGGSWFAGVQAGVFSLDLSVAPSRYTTTVGMRCAAP